MAPLDERKQTVLRAVVQDHIRTADPVGSGTIARRYRLGVSPATIRSELAALEELGYLTQPHTSAGRVPTDHGYRFYVDGLPRGGGLSRSIAEQIRTFFDEPAGDVDELLHSTASFLSRLTGYAAIALSPQAAGSHVLRAELVPVGSAVMLLVVSDTGRVDKRVLEVGGPPDERIVRRASELLSGRLSGLSFDAAADRVSALAREIAVEERRLIGEVADCIRHLRDPESEHVFVGGVANIAGEPDFERRESLRELVETLEERTAVLGLLEAASDALGEVTVRIGSENALRALNEASVVVAWYEAQGRPAGAVAVVGPTRMRYPKAISAAETVADRLSGVLGGFAG